MRIKSAVVPLTTAAGLIAAVAIAPGGVFGATPTNDHLVGWAGGSMVRGLGHTVTSDLTSQSSVDTTSTGVRSTNTLATASVSRLLTVGAISTDASSAAVPHGVQLTTHARTANVSLLGGAITAKAVDTVDVARVVSGKASSTIRTTFVGLKIAGTTLPATISQNFGVRIPGVAQVTLNGAYSAAKGDTIMTTGVGLYVSLLKARGTNPIGTEIYLNPTYGAIAPTAPVTGANIGGYAYGSSVYASAGKLFDAKSGPTAQISQPMNGTRGLNQYNRTASVDVAPVATVSAITSTANGVKSAGTASYSTMSTKLAGINLFNGLIRADALTGSASVKELPDGSTRASTSTSLVNLVVAGRSLPVDVSPNTVIRVAGLGKVTIRSEARSANQALVKVLDIVITTKGYGLPVGAEVQVGVAAAWVITPR
jgi:hypothetical protein